MKKIGILTFHKSVNYGSVLQAYALKQALLSLGCEAEVIDYEPDNYKFLYGLFRPPVNMDRIKYDVVSLMHAGLLKHRIKLFAQFREKHLNLSKEKYRFGDDMSVLNDRYDVVICGSDQIWNPKAKDSDINYYLPIPHRIGKVAYAVSLNDGFADEYQDKEKYKKLITDFDALSVREDTARDDLSAFLGSRDDIEVVLDPSLLLDKSEYEPICAERRVDRPYIFLYSVHHNLTAVRAAQTLSKRLDMPVYFLYTDSRSHRTARDFKEFIYPKKDTSPAEFISFIKNAALVVTDSFHGTAFSMIFEKRFYSIAKTDESGGIIRDKRIYGILSKLGATSRFISEQDAATVDLDEEPDYAVINAKRGELMKHSLDYLKASIK